MHHASETAEVVILGAGFAGLSVARALVKNPKIRVTVVDPRRDFHFTPRLVDALGKVVVKPSWVKTNIEALSKREGFTFIHGTATHVMRTSRNITLETPMGSKNIPYDILVISSGAKTNWFNIPGAKEHALPLKREEDVDQIHAAIRNACRLARDLPPQDQKRRLSFIVVGGGPTGVEGVFMLKKYAESFLKEEAPELQDGIACTLVQAGPQILPGFPQNVVDGSTKEMRQQGIQCLVGSPVMRVTADDVTLTSGMTIPASVVVWAAGITPNVPIFEPEVSHDTNNCLVVDATLRLDERMYAAGDAVAFKEQNRLVPKNAQTAMRMADAIQKNIQRQLRSEKPHAFHYQALGNLILLGDTGFINVGGLSWKTRFTSTMRHLFYALRHWQIVG